jgi:hypothetical protein
LKALRVGWSRGFIYETRSPHEHQIENAWLTVPTRDPCSGGYQPQSLTIDGVLTRWLPPGIHEIELLYLHQLDDFDIDAVVDLATKDGRCVRAPAINRSVRMEGANRTLLLGAAGGYGSSNGVRMEAIFDVKLGVGRWVGPFLLAASGGAAVVGCDEFVCSQDTVWGVPLAFDLRYNLGSRALHHTLWVGLLGLSYTYLYATLPMVTGDRSIGIHVIHGTLGYGSRNIPLGPFRHRERGGLLEMNVRLGVMSDPGVGKTTFSGGMELRLLSPL